MNTHTYEIKMLDSQSMTGKGDAYISWECRGEVMRQLSKGVEVKKKSKRLDNLERNV